MEYGFSSQSFLPKLAETLYYVNLEYVIKFRSAVIFAVSKKRYHTSYTPTKHWGNIQV